MIKWGILSTAKIATEQIIPAILESKILSFMELLVEI